MSSTYNQNHNWWYVKAEKNETGLKCKVAEELKSMSEPGGLRFDSLLFHFVYVSKCALFIFPSFIYLLKDAALKYTSAYVT